MENKTFFWDIFTEALSNGVLLRKKQFFTNVNHFYLDLFCIGQASARGRIKLTLLVVERFLGN